MIASRTSSSSFVSEQERISDIMSGPAHLHRDLELENFIVDFGLSAKLDHQDGRRFSVCGASNYLNWWIISDGPKRFGYETDIWAIGDSNLRWSTAALHSRNLSGRPVQIEKRA
jgi:polo-like kinase 1